jgi:hypothetical protein
MDLHVTNLPLPQSKNWAGAQLCRSSHFHKLVYIKLFISLMGQIERRATLEIRNLLSCLLFLDYLPWPLQFGQICFNRIGSTRRLSD